MRNLLQASQVPVQYHEADSETGGMAAWKLPCGLRSCVEELRLLSFFAIHCLCLQKEDSYFYIFWFGPSSKLFILISQEIFFLEQTLMGKT